MIHKLFPLLVLSLTGVATAQYSTSPFSTQGLGEAGGLEEPQFGGIGTCRTAYMDSLSVNLFNPSSYAFLSKGQPLFSIGISSRFSRFTEDGNSSDGRVVGISHIAMVIPATRRLGFAVGLQPFTRRGYEIVQKQQVEADTFRYTYFGSGSTQQVLGGVSFKVLDFKRHTLALGANYAFLFGSVNSERRSELIGNDPAGGVDKEEYRLHSGYYTLGMNYTTNLDFQGNSQLRVAAVYTPQQSLSAHRDYMLFYATDVADQRTYSILDSIEDDKGTIVYPSSMSLGFSYSFQPEGGVDYKHKSVYQVMVFGDFSSTDWKSYSARFSNEQPVNPMVNSQRFSLGAQFTPNVDASDRKVKNYFGRIRYRTGGYFETLPYMDNGTQLTGYGITAGFGLPISNQQSNSSFNISLLYGNRGTGGGLKEQFVSFNVGLIIAPARYERWFRKVKLD